MLFLHCEKSFGYKELQPAVPSPNLVMWNMARRRQKTSKPPRINPAHEHAQPVEVETTFLRVCGKDDTNTPTEQAEPDPLTIAGEMQEEPSAGHRTYFKCP